MAKADWGAELDTETPETVELNLTSLVDVMMVLLIIFMVSTAVVTDSGRAEQSATAVDLQLPAGAQQTTDHPPVAQVIVQMNADGALFDSGTATDRKTLAKDLAERVGKEPELTVRVEADQKLTYQQVAELLGELQSLGIKNVSLGMGKK